MKRWQSWAASTSSSPRPPASPSAASSRPRPRISTRRSRPCSAAPSTRSARRSPTSSARGARWWRSARSPPGCRCRGSAAYTASKHGLVGFLDTVRLELDDGGSSVTLSMVNPGAVDTPLWNNLESSTGLLPPELPFPAVYSPDTVAEAVLSVIRHPRDELTAGGLARTQVLFYSLFGAAGKRAMRALARLEHTAGDRPAGDGRAARRRGRERPRAASAAVPASRSRRWAPGTGCCAPSGGAEMAADAVVIGAGPNGLVAANQLADRGWNVVVCEEQPEPGGAVRSGEVTEPGFIHDLYSAFYPLTLASRYIAPLRARALRAATGCSARGVVAHPHAGRPLRAALDGPGRDLRLARRLRPRRRRRLAATLRPLAQARARTWSARC